MGSLQRKVYRYVFVYVYISIGIVYLYPHGQNKPLLLGFGTLRCEGGGLDFHGHPKTRGLLLDRLGGLQNRGDKGLSNLHRLLYFYTPSSLPLFTGMDEESCVFFRVNPQTFLPSLFGGSSVPSPRCHCRCP